MPKFSKRTVQREYEAITDFSGGKALQALADKYCLTLEQLLNMLNI